LSILACQLGELRLLASGRPASALFPQNRAQRVDELDDQKQSDECEKTIDRIKTVGEQCPASGTGSAPKGQPKERIERKKRQGDTSKVLLRLERYFLIGIGKHAILLPQDLRKCKLGFGSALKFQARVDDQQTMIDGILHIASLAFRAVHLLIERPEQRRQYSRLAQWQEFVPAPIKTRQPVRIVQTGHR
jgi:hypothetical protein